MKVMIPNYFLREGLLQLFRVSCDRCMCEWHDSIDNGRIQTIDGHNYVDGRRFMAGGRLMYECLNCHILYPERGKYRPQCPRCGITACRQYCSQCGWTT